MKRPAPAPKPVAAVVSVAQSIADIQRRQAAIVKRQAVIDAEAERLDEENGRLEIRRLELLREFDTAAR